MGKRRPKQVPEGRSWRKPLIVGALAVAALGAAGAWWLRSVPEAAGGTPRLVVDRTDVDLGFQRFDSTARVVFMLANTGDGPLRLPEAPRIKVVAGC